MSVWWLFLVCVFSMLVVLVSPRHSRAEFVFSILALASFFSIPFGCALGLVA